MCVFCFTQDKITVYPKAYQEAKDMGCHKTLPLFENTHLRFVFFKDL